MDNNQFVEKLVENGFYIQREKGACYFSGLGVRGVVAHGEYFWGPKCANRVCFDPIGVFDKPTTCSVRMKPSNGWDVFLGFVAALNTPEGIKMARHFEDIFVE